MALLRSTVVFLFLIFQIIASAEIDRSESVVQPARQQGHLRRTFSESPPQVFPEHGVAARTTLRGVDNPRDTSRDAALDLSSSSSSSKAFSSYHEQRKEEDEPHERVLLVEKDESSSGGVGVQQTIAEKTNKSMETKGSSAEKEQEPSQKLLTATSEVKTIELAKLLKSSTETLAKKDTSTIASAASAAGVAAGTVEQEDREKQNQLAREELIATAKEAARASGEHSEMRFRSVIQQVQILLNQFSADEVRRLTALFHQYIEAEARVQPVRERATGIGTRLRQLGTDFEGKRAYLKGLEERYGAKEVQEDAELYDAPKELFYLIVRFIADKKTQNLALARSKGDQTK